MRSPNTPEACAPQMAACASGSSTEAVPFMKSFLAAFLLVAASVFAHTPSQKRPFTFEDMMKLKRVGAPVPSPDGKWVVLDGVRIDLEANSRIPHLCICRPGGGSPRL